MQQGLEGYRFVFFFQRRLADNPEPTIVLTRLITTIFIVSGKISYIGGHFSFSIQTIHVIIVPLKEYV